MDEKETQCPQNYFDGMKMSKKQMHFIWLMVAGTFIEQVDSYKFSFIAPALKEVWGLSVGQISTINACFAIGALFGGVFSAWFADRFGRHIGMTLALLLGGIGALITSLSPSYELLLVFRTICGFGIAAAIVLEAPYLCEMVPGEHRSRWQGIIGIIGVLGIPISAFIARKILAFGPETWRYVAAIPSIGILIAILFWFIVPESPRWLVAHNRMDEAKKIFKNLTGQELLIDTTHCRNDVKVSYIETLKIMGNHKYIKRSIFCLTICVVLNNTGWMVNQLLPTLLVSEGLDTESSMFVQELLTVSMVLAPLFLVLFGDKGGRKLPYAFTMCVTGISLFFLAQIGISNVNYLYITVLMIGWAMFTHQNFAVLFSSELFPTRVRSMVIGVINILVRIGMILSQALIVPFLYNNYGFKGYFSTLAAIYLIMSLFILVIAPKTAGKSLEELNSDI